MKQVISFLRVNEWLTSKVTLMIGILLFFSYINSTTLIDVTKEIVVYFLFVSMFLAFSYVINDYSDIEVDKKAGKKKEIALMPRWLIFLSMFLMILIGNVPIIIISEKRITCVVLIIITYVMGMAYSTLGLRFKEKGVWGLMECSFAQRCMPLLLIGVLEQIKGILLIYLAGWLAVSFLDGLRYILIHQVVDMDNDIKSGVKTLVTEERKNYRNVIIAFWVIEIVIITVVLIPMWNAMPIVMALVYFSYIGLEFCIYMVLNVYAEKDWFVTFDSVPLEAFLNTVFPVVMGGFMVKTLGWWMLVYCVLIIFICFKSFKIKVDLALIFIKSKIERR